MPRFYSEKTPKLLKKTQKVTFQFYMTFYQCNNTYRSLSCFPFKLFRYNIFPTNINIRIQNLSEKIAISDY